MFDLNRPLHAYDLDKIKNSIRIRNSKKGEILKALDNKTYTLKENMCVIADDVEQLKQVILDGQLS